MPRQITLHVPEFATPQAVKHGLYWAFIALHVATGAHLIWLIVDHSSGWWILANLVAVPVTFGWVWVMREAHLDDRLPSMDDWNNPTGGGGNGTTFYDPNETEPQHANN